MKYWSTSLAIHGVIVGLGAVLWPEAPAETAPLPFRWEVAFVPAPPRVQPSPPAPTPPPPVSRPEPQRPPPLRPAEPVPPRPQPAAVEPTPPAVPEALPSQAPAPVAEASTAMPVTPARVAASTPAPASAAVVAPPVAARPPPPDAVAAAAAIEAERRWYAALAERLRQMKRYPMIARRLGQEGVVVLTLQVAADGSVAGIAIKQGSGYAALDRDALALVQDAAGATRGELRPERAARLEIPIAYRLRD